MQRANSPALEAGLNIGSQVVSMFSSFFRTPERTPEAWEGFTDQLSIPRIINIHLPKTDLDKTESEEKSGKKTLFRFFTKGCDGVGGKMPEIVADYMNRVAEKSAPGFILQLGDNIYPDGAESPIDENFNRCIDNILRNPRLNTLSKLPVLAILGNHDVGHHGKGKSGRVDANSYKIKAQILRTFVDKEVYKRTGDIQLDQNIINRLSAKSISLTDLPPWVMPHQYGVYVIHGLPIKIKIFYINSGTYVESYMDAQEQYKLGNTVDPEKNQAVWLETEVRKAQAENPNDVLFLAGHQGLISLSHRANCEPDSRYFLETTEIPTIIQELMKEHKTRNNKESYHELLYVIIHKLQKLSFDADFSAHDHSISYTCQPDATESTTEEKPSTSLHKPKRPGVYQIISAGGGSSELHYRTVLHNWEQVLFHAYNLGFIAVEVYQENGEIKIGLDVYTLKYDETLRKYVDGVHLRIDDIHQPKLALSDKVKHDTAYMALRDIILEAYGKYIDNISTMKKGYVDRRNPFSSHGPGGIKRAADLQNYFNHYEGYGQYGFLIAAQWVIKELGGRYRSITEDSLQTKIGEAMFEKFKVSYSQFSSNPQLLLDAIDKKQPKLTLKLNKTQPVTIPAPHTPTSTTEIKIDPSSSPYISIFSRADEIPVKITKSSHLLFRMPRHTRTQSAGDLLATTRTITGGSRISPPRKCSLDLTNKEKDKDKLVSRSNSLVR